MRTPTAHNTVSALVAASVALCGLAGCGGNARSGHADGGNSPQEVSVNVKSEERKQPDDGKGWNASPSDGTGLRMETAPDGSVAVVANGDGHVDTTLAIDTQDLLVVSPHKIESGTMHLSIAPANGGTPVYEGDFGPDTKVEPVNVPVGGDYFKLDVTSSGCKGTVEVMLSHSQPAEGADAGAGGGQA